VQYYNLAATLAMKIFTDQLNRTIEVPDSPQRIISVVPSQTELLHYLGLKNEVIGITKFCVHPDDWFRTKTRVGGTKTLNLDKIRSLQPDLIIANKEENDQSQIETLAKEFPVWISDINHVTDALEMIKQVGEMTNTTPLAQQLIADVTKGFTGIQPLYGIRTAYFIWRAPWMLAGHTTYINDLMQRCGMVNVFSTQDSRYPAVTNEAIAAANPQLILLSSEPYPFKDKHLAELQALCPQAQILLVDGEMFSWYGNRMLEAAGYLEGLVQDIKRGTAS
jgi:ABC-type Fe3+-hydroxamate transport system substrate-binding protein